MGKKRIIAETGAGQNGVATATVAARLGLECHIYMGAADVERQSLNVYRIKLLGAKVHAVDSGTATLKDALNEAMRDWVTNIEDTYYIIEKDKEIKLVPEMLNLLGCSKDNFKKLIEKMNYKTLEKDNDIYFRYNPKKQIKKTFKKMDTSNSPFKILKNLNLN